MLDASNLVAAAGTAKIGWIVGNAAAGTATVAVKRCLLPPRAAPSLRVGDVGFFCAGLRFVVSPRPLSANSTVHDNVHDVAVDIDLSIFIGLHYEQLTESKGGAIVRILPAEPL